MANLNGVDAFILIGKVTGVRRTSALRGFLISFSGNESVKSIRFSSIKLNL